MKARSPHALTGRVERCRAKTREGKPCPAHPVRGVGFCYWHIPGNASAKGSIGGRRRAIFDPKALLPIAPPRNIQDVKNLVYQTIVDLREAKIDSKTAQAILYGCNVGRALEQSAEFEARLRAVETGDHRHNDDPLQVLKQGEPK